MDLDRHPDTSHDGFFLARQQALRTKVSFRQFLGTWWPRSLWNVASGVFGAVLYFERNDANDSQLP